MFALIFPDVPRSDSLPKSANYPEFYRRPTFFTISGGPIELTEMPLEDFGFNERKPHLRCFDYR